MDRGNNNETKVNLVKPAELFGFYQREREFLKPGSDKSSCRRGATNDREQSGGVLREVSFPRNWHRVASAKALGERVAPREPNRTLS